MRIGTIKQIWRFAVKSMAGEQLDVCTVGMRGIPGDRGWAIRNDTVNRLATGSGFPLLMQCAARYREPPVNGLVPHVDMRLPDGTHIGSDLADVNARLTTLLGKPVSLCRLASDNADQSAIQLDSARGTYFDVAPIHVLTSASLAEMKRLAPAGDWDIRRFRPNFFVETEAELEGLVDAEWGGRTLRIGEVEILCELPCERCAMTIHAQPDVRKDESIFRTIVKEANTNLGSYASVLKPGEVRVGDLVELI
ncbi:MAG TPA: MOSC domain-containing protein [Pyrinomonadaceae bacterium]|nr:MOSC domain-containing protein [Pyrinomonadaceae bacterium]